MDLSSAMTHRRRRHAGPVGPAAGDRGESRQCRIDGLAPGGDPYRRKTVSFAERRDRGTGLELVDVGRYGGDRGDFELRYQPGHPAADAEGYVKYPNVNPLIELVDMREAQRSYEANLNALQLARTMIGARSTCCARRA